MDRLGRVIVVLNAIERGVAGRLRSLPWLSHVRVASDAECYPVSTIAVRCGWLAVCLSVRCEFRGFLALVPCL